MKLFTVLLLVATTACSQTKDEKAISDVLVAQAAAWSRGDIETYMHGYWNDDSLVFIGKNGPAYGYDATLRRYKTSYGDTAKMGKLTFSDLHMKKLSPEYYYVNGHWHLARSIGDLSGYFTLIFRKIKGRWLIIADHSS